MKNVKIKTLSSTPRIEYMFFVGNFHITMTISHFSIPNPKFNIMYIMEFEKYYKNMLYIFQTFLKK